MANELKKEAFLQFKDEPHLRPISDEGIGFYNLDINTSVLTFQLTKQDKPLLISDKNVTAYAYFKSDNGSTSGVLDLEFKDPMNGIVTITLPKDFLQASTGTKVTGQTYISTNGKEDTAVFSEFTFTVKNALINTISSAVKIEYIKMFDRLKQEIEKRVHDIEQAIANGSDYVAQMQNVLSEGIKLINDTVAQTKKDLNTTATNATNAINSTKNSAVTTVNSARDSVLNAIQANQVVKTTDLPAQFNALSWQKYKLTNDDGTNFYDSSLKIDFTNTDQLNSLPTGTRYVVNSVNIPSNVSPSGWLTKYSRPDSQSMLIQYQPYNSSAIYQKSFYKTWSDWQVVNPDYSKTLDWQRYKLTNDDGTRKWLGTLSSPVESLEPGLYECTIPANANTVNAPLDVNNSSYIAELNITKSNSGRKQIILIQNYTEDMWLKTIHTSGTDRGWTLLNPKPSDTGWVPFQLTNGATSNSEYTDKNGFQCSYRVVTNGPVTTNYLRINGRNITPGQTIAQLPPTMVKNAQSFSPRTPTNKPAGFMTIYPDGTVSFFINEGTSPNKWDNTAYIYGEYSWTN